MPERTKIAVVGSINVDFTAVLERLPSAGETIGGGVLTKTAGGKGANQAAAAARLGGQVRMIGAVGDDPEGRLSREELEGAGVDVSAVRTVDAATGVALIGVDASGENQIMVCPGANALLDPAVIRVDADETVIAQLEIAVDVVVAAARQRPAFLAVNASPAQPLPPELLEGADLFIVNETEYELMPELASAPRVVVTYGSKGSAMLEHGVETARVDALKVESVNSVGAGDSYCAALVLALRQGMDDAAALSVAAAVGAAAVQDERSQPRFDRLETYVAG